VEWWRCQQVEAAVVAAEMEVVVVAAVVKSFAYVYLC
jgi:hypothetical protein